LLTLRRRQQAQAKLEGFALSTAIGVICNILDLYDTGLIHQEEAQTKEGVKCWTTLCFGRDSRAGVSRPESYFFPSSKVKVAIMTTVLYHHCLPSRNRGNSAGVVPPLPKPFPYFGQMVSLTVESWCLTHSLLLWLVQEKQRKSAAISS